MGLLDGVGLPAEGGCRGGRESVHRRMVKIVFRATGTWSQFAMRAAIRVDGPLAFSARSYSDRDPRRESRQGMPGGFVKAVSARAGEEVLSYTGNLCNVRFTNRTVEGFRCADRESDTT